MHAQKRGAGLLETLGEVDGVSLLVRPPAPELRGNRDIHGIDDGAYDLAGEFGSLHEGRSLATAHDLAHGTAHVHVDEREPIAQTLGDTSGLARHAIGLRAEELHGEHAFLVCRLDERESPHAIVFEALGTHHLGKREPCAMSKAQAPESAIGHAGHRREPKRRGEVCV